MELTKAQKNKFKIRELEKRIKRLEKAIKRLGLGMILSEEEWS